MIASQLCVSECSSSNLSAIGQVAAASVGAALPEPPGHELLRWFAEEADTSGTSDDMRGVWPSLLDGKLHVVDAFYSPDRWFLVLKRGLLRGLSEDVRAILEHSLLDDSQKRAAFECGLAGSTLSMRVRQAFRSRGVNSSPRKAPPILALAALVGSARRSVAARCSSLRFGGAEFIVYSVARPECGLAARLSAAELGVLLRVVEGWSYAQISAERRTSCRTVANQVAHAFHRLGVSGRGQLIGLLLRLVTEPVVSPQLTDFTDSARVAAQRTSRRLVRPSDALVET